MTHPVLLLQTPSTTEAVVVSGVNISEVTDQDKLHEMVSTMIVCRAAFLSCLIICRHVEAKALFELGWGHGLYPMADMSGKLFESFLCMHFLHII